MAENRKITIEILSTSSSSNNKNSKGKKKDEKKENAEAIKDTLNQMFHPIEQDPGVKLLSANVILSQAAQHASQLIENGINYSIKRYTTLKEDYILENNLNNINFTINRVKRLTGSITSGALSGALTGSVGGAVAGAVIGTASTLVSFAQEDSQRRSAYYQDLNATNLQTQFAQQRAGLYNNGRGTEN